MTNTPYTETYTAAQTEPITQNATCKREPADQKRIPLMHQTTIGTSNLCRHVHTDRKLLAI